MQTFESMNDTSSFWNDLIRASYALQKLTELEPRDPGAFNLFGMVLEKLGLFERACQAYEQALLLSPIDGIRANYARAMISAGRYQEAHYHFEQISLKDVYNLVGDGIAQFFNGDLVASLTCFQKALSIAQDLSEKSQTSVHLAQVLFALGTEQHRDLAIQQLLQWYFSES